MSLSRTVRFYYARFKRLQGSSHSLALGSALGTFIGLTPTVPLHTLLIVGCCLVFRANPLAGILMANVVSNPFTFIAHYYLAWKFGDFFLPGRLTWDRLQATLDLIKAASLTDSLGILQSLGLDALLVMMTGGLILGLPAGVLCYLLVYRFFGKLRQKRRQRHLLNRTDA